MSQVLSERTTMLLHQQIFQKNKSSIRQKKSENADKVGFVHELNEHGRIWTALAIVLARG